jgi:chloramphenicol-sensitive protein RarD
MSAVACSMPALRPAVPLPSRALSVDTEGSRAGLLYGLAAYGLWGVLPLYFAALTAVRPLELLAHRITWSVLFLAFLLTGWRRWPELVRALSQPGTRRLLLITTGLIGVNWFVFIYAVWSKQTVQSSLGYFINPLFSIVLGVVVFRERLRPAQWGALLLAAGGLIFLVVALGTLPWIALVLAGSFGLYGLFRKLAPVDGVIGLSVETLLLLPLSSGYLVFLSARGEQALGRLGWEVGVLLLLSGAVTAVPLICFGQAARRLRLSVLGFLQYLAPSLQLILAVTVLGETFLPQQKVAFACIWAALAVVTLDALWAQRQRARQARAAACVPCMACP